MSERPIYTKCVYCGEPFTAQNVFTQDGWREIKISGVCEVCFDNCTLPDEEPTDMVEVAKKVIDDHRKGLEYLADKDKEPTDDK